jgi:hypothetical protein
MLSFAVVVELSAFPLFIAIVVPVGGSSLEHPRMPLPQSHNRLSASQRTTLAILGPIVCAALLFWLLHEFLPNHNSASEQDGTTATTSLSLSASLTCKNIEDIKDTDGSEMGPKTCVTAMLHNATGDEVHFQGVEYSLYNTQGEKLPVDRWISAAMLGLNLPSAFTERIIGPDQTITVEDCGASSAGLSTGVLWFGGKPVKLEATFLSSDISIPSAEANCNEGDNVAGSPSTD